MALRDARARVALATTEEDARADLEEGLIQKPTEPQAVVKRWSLRPYVRSFEESIQGALMSKDDKWRLKDCNLSREELVAQYESKELAHLNGFEKLKKVHLIAPANIAYDPTQPLTTLVAYSGTCLELVLKRPDFWLLFIFHAAISLTYFGLGLEVKGDTPTARGWPQVNVSMLAVVGGLITFVLVFYLNQTYGRYVAQSDHVGCAAGLLLELVALMRVLLWDHAFPEARIVRHELAKLLNAFHILAYASLPTMREVKANEWAWWYLAKTNLLTDDQVAQLKPLQALGAGNLAYKEVMVWTTRGIWAQVSKKHLKARAAELLTHKLWAVRGQLDALYGFVSGPLPFAYYHLLNFILLAYLVLLGYAFVFISTFWSIPCFFLILVGLLGLRELGNAMSNPLGHDSTDIPIFNFAQDFLQRSVELVNTESNYPDELDALKPADSESPGAATLDGIQADDDEDAGFVPDQISSI